MPMPEDYEPSARVGSVTLVGVISIHLEHDKDRYCEPDDPRANRWMIFMWGPDDEMGFERWIRYYDYKSRERAEGEAARLSFIANADAFHPNMTMQAKAEERAALEKVAQEHREATERRK